MASLDILIKGGEFELQVAEKLRPLLKALPLPDEIEARVEFEWGAPSPLLLAGMPKHIDALTAEGLLPIGFQGYHGSLFSSNTGVIVLSVGEDLTSPLWRHVSDNSYYHSLPGWPDPTKSAWFVHHYRLIEGIDPQDSLTCFQSIIEQLSERKNSAVCLCNVFRGLNRTRRHRYFGGKPSQRERTLAFNLNIVALSRTYCTYVVDVDNAVGYVGFADLLSDPLTVNDKMAALAAEEIRTTLVNSEALDFLSPV